MTEIDENAVWVKVTDEEMVNKHGCQAMTNWSDDDVKVVEHNYNKLCPPKPKKTRKELEDEKNQNDDTYYPLEKVEEIDQLLFLRLISERKARRNWRTLMTMISIVKHLSERESKEMLYSREENLEPAVTNSSKFWEFKWADRYVKSPDSRIMSLWTLLALSMNTASIFIVYFECAFHLKAWEKEESWIYLIEFILLLEIIVTFFKAYDSKDGGERGWLLSVFGICGCCKKKKEQVFRVG